MDYFHLREALSARLDDEEPALDVDRIEAHLSGCTACASYAHDLGVLHRLTRVRAADDVPDLSAAILGATPQRAAVDAYEP